MASKQYIANLCSEIEKTYFDKENPNLHCQTYQKCRTLAKELIKLLDQLLDGLTGEIGSNAEILILRGQVQALRRMYREFSGLRGRREEIRQNAETIDSHWFTFQKEMLTTTIQIVKELNSLRTIALH